MYVGLGAEGFDSAGVDSAVSGWVARVVALDSLAVPGRGGVLSVAASAESADGVALNETVVSCGVASLGLLTGSSAGDWKMAANTPRSSTAARAGRVQWIPFAGPLGIADGDDSSLVGEDAGGFSGSSSLVETSAVRAGGCASMMARMASSSGVLPANFLRSSGVARQSAARMASLSASLISSADE